MRTEPLVSLITIDYNSPSYTSALIESLNKSEYKNWELIIVDNGNTQEAEKTFISLPSNIKYFKTNKNLGFAGGNNLGIKHSQGEFLFFINNDTEVTPKLIGQLVNSLIEKNEIGLICPKIKYYNTNLIQYAGYTELSIAMRNKTIGNKCEDSSEFSSLTRTAYAHGAAMMTRKEVIEKAGMMPELYFLYYEEMDWSMMIKNAGYQIWVNQSAVVFHKESMSIGKSSPLKTYYLTRNRILFSRRNNKLLKNAIFIIYSYFLLLPIKSVIYILAQEWKHLKSFVKAHTWHLSNNPLK